MSKCRRKGWRRRGFARRMYGLKLHDRLARLARGDISRAARARLDYLEWHRAHGANVALTCRHFAIARTTFYRWQARFDRTNLASLEDRSSRPVRRRKPTWTLAQLVAVRDLRERYPRWGKDKLGAAAPRGDLLVDLDGRPHPGPPGAHRRAA